MKTLVDRADRLATRAVSGFQKAHDHLKEAQRLLDQEQEEQRQAADEWRRQVEEAIATAEEAAQQAQARYNKNARTLAKLAEFVE